MSDQEKSKAHRMEESQASGDDPQSRGDTSSALGSQPPPSPPPPPCSQQAASNSSAMDTSFETNQTSKRSPGGPGEKRTGEAAASGERKGTEDSSINSASALAGHKRQSASAALADSSSSASGATGEHASKKSKGITHESGAAAAASSSAAAAASSTSPSSHPSKLQPRPSFFCPAQTLLEELAPLSQALVTLRRSTLAPIEASTVAELEDAREELRQLQTHVIESPQLLLEMQPRIKQLQGEIQDIEKWLVEEEEVKLEEQTTVQHLRAQLSRAEGELSASQLTASVAQNISVCRWCCSGLLSSDIPLELQLQMVRWEVRACWFLQQLASTLTADEIRVNPCVISACARVGFLSTVQRMLQLSGCACVIETRRGNPYLSLLAADFMQHDVSLTPLQHFIRDGLDPTLVSEESPQSALQLARSHVQAHPLTGEVAQSELQTEMEDSGCDGSSGSRPPRDFAIDYATQQTTASRQEEDQRRAELHTRFMHTLVSTWRAHSSQVRALLEAPLIPDLANICAEYLDLEPAEKHQ